MNETITIQLTPNEVTATLGALKHQADRLGKMKGGTDSQKRWRGYEVNALRGLVHEITRVSAAEVETP